MRLLTAAGLPLILTASALAPAAAAAATVSPPLALQTCPTDLAVDAAGNVQLLTRTQRRGRWTVSVSTVDAAGKLTPGPTTSRPWKRPNAVRSVFTQDGYAVAFETGKPKPPVYDTAIPLAAAARAKRPETVSVTMVGPGGASAPQVISDPKRSADLHEITSNGGTTVVHFRQSVPKVLRLQDWIAVRPAGASRFGKAVSLKSSIRDRFSDDQVFLGPDGSGVVISTPTAKRAPVSLRRISADGRVGRAIPFGTRPADIAKATAAIGADGRVVVAVVDTAKPKSYGRLGLFVAQIAPGATELSTPRMVGTARGRGEDALALAIDGAGRVTATLGREYAEGSTTEYDAGFYTFSGTADALVRGPDIDGSLGVGDTPVLTPTADGSVALTWEGDESIDAEDFNRGQRVAFRGADGSWSTPTWISPPFKWTTGTFAINRASAALPGSGVAMAYSIERAKTTCAFVRITP